MRWFRFAVVVIIASILQEGLLGQLKYKPDLLLILLVFFAIYSNSRDAIITSFIVGFAADITGSAMGTQMLSFGLFGVLISYLNSIISVKKMLYQGIVIFCIGILTALFANLLLYIKDPQQAAKIYTDIFLSSLYTAVVGPFLFLPCAWLMRIKVHRLRRL